MPAVRLAALLMALAAAAPLAAQAQWQWLDAEGRRVFSDRPPPPEVPTARILRQPGVRPPAAAGPAATEAMPAPPPAPAAAPRATGKDPALEERKNQAAAAEAARVKAEQERVARQRAETCGRARRAKATLDSGVRLSTTNANGELEVMDDAARARETERVQRILATDCAALAGARQ